MKNCSSTFFAWLLFVLIHAWGTGTVCAQAFPSESLQQKENERIVQSSHFFSPIDYCLADGTELSRKELLDLLATVPENDSLLQKTKVCRVVGYCMLGLTVAALGTFVVYAGFDKLPAREEVQSAAVYTAYFLAIGSMLPFQTGVWYEKKAVKRYNLYIMGLPLA